MHETIRAEGFDVFRCLDDMYSFFWNGFGLKFEACKHDSGLGSARPETLLHEHAQNRSDSLEKFRETYNPYQGYAHRQKMWSRGSGHRKCRSIEIALRRRSCQKHPSFPPTGVGKRGPVIRTSFCRASRNQSPVPQCCPECSSFPSFGAKMVLADHRE